MADSTDFLAKRRYAVVTGANKGIGLEICKQLASKGVVVVLTARDEKRGRAAVETLKQSGISSDNLDFHQVDVTNSTSIASLGDFIKAKFGTLDILINNAGIGGTVTHDFEALRASGFGTPGVQADLEKMEQRTRELAEDCLKTNYYGVKRTIETLLPLLQLSDSPRIVSISSALGKLKHISNERFRAILGDANNLTEEIVDEVVADFQRDLNDSEIVNEIVADFIRDPKNGLYPAEGWSRTWVAYIVSKAALNAYSRVLARNYPSIIINCVCPGFVKTDINTNTGILSVEEGVQTPVRLALLPSGSPSGLFFETDHVTSFDE